MKSTYCSMRRKISYKNPELIMKLIYLLFHGAIVGYTLYLGISLSELRTIDDWEGMVFIFVFFYLMIMGIALKKKQLTLWNTAAYFLPLTIELVLLLYNQASFQASVVALGFIGALSSIIITAYLFLSSNIQPVKDLRSFGQLISVLLYIGAFIYAGFEIWRALFPIYLDAIGTYGSAYFVIIVTFVSTIYTSHTLIKSAKN